MIPRASEDPLDVDTLPMFPMGRHASRDHDDLAFEDAPRPGRRPPKDPTASS